MDKKYINELKEWAKDIVIAICSSYYTTVY